MNDCKCKFVEVMAENKSSICVTKDDDLIIYGSHIGGNKQIKND